MATPQPDGGVSALNAAQQALISGVSPTSALPFTLGSPFVTVAMGKYVQQLRAYSGAALAGRNNLNPTAAYIYTGSDTHVSPDFNPTIGIPVKQQFANAPKVKTGSYQSLASMMNDFESWSIKKKEHMGQLLYMAGYLTPSSSTHTPAENLKHINLMDITSAYGNLLQSAASRFASGKMQTPQDLLEMNIRFNMSQAGINVEGQKFDPDSWWNQINKKLAPDQPNPNDPNSPNFTGTKTTTSRHVDIYSPEDTKGLVRSVLNQELGRDPTQAEMEDFSAALTHAMHANPTTTTENAVYKNGQVVSDNSTSHQGITSSGLQEVATEKAQDTPGWADWQAIGTYLPAVFNALGTTVPGT